MIDLAGAAELVHTADSTASAHLDIDNPAGDGPCGPRIPNASSEALRGNGRRTERRGTAIGPRCHRGKAQFDGPERMDGVRIGELDSRLHFGPGDDACRFGAGPSGCEAS